MSTSKKVNNSSKKMTANSSKEEEDVCVVCFRSVEIYSVGDCDHPVCYECSTRMRVLIDRTECPICRKDMSQVVFISKKNLAPFRNLNTRNMSCERRYAIFFESDKEMLAYDTLLEHPCPVCREQRVFKNFEELKSHVSQQHQRYYCDLCVFFLKIFTRERRAYTRPELAQHRRKGDPDDTSHRGHPLCEFCDMRYLDSDELFRHLRKDHFYCHFCDADGLHQYYDDYPALRQHFRRSHFLCEEGDCKNEQFTSVFRDKIDLQGHFLDNHADNKRAARQARTVDIEFTVNHAPSLL
ncbi:Zinc finger RING-type [Trinorchestia longiramus]|nr:Zinc finger RING-type [Trinorchestia longiramus]